MRRGVAVALGIALAGGAAAGVLALRRAPLAAVVSSPETQVKASLRAMGAVRLDLGAGAEAVLEPVRFPDVAVWPDESGAGVIAMLEAEGRVRVPVRGDVPAGADRPGSGEPAHEATLSYVGREQFRVERDGATGWRPAGTPAPALAAVLRTLLARADAFRRADAGAYAALVSPRYAGPGGKPALLARLGADFGGGVPGAAARDPAPRPALRVRAWQIRIERDRATAGEDQEVAVPGAAPGAAPARLRARYDLVREPDGRWLIADGL